MRTQDRLLGAGLVTLGATMAIVAVLGPLVLDVLRYRISATSLNQIIGGDAAALAVVGPITVAVGVLALQGHRAAPLLLAVFVLAGALALRAWNSVPVEHLPSTSPGVDRTAGVLLLVIAAFVVVGLHLPNYLDAMRDHPGTVQYLSSPTAFWLVKFMDLGIVVPAAVTVGIGTLRHRPWARKPVYALLGAYTLIGASVAGMAITMVARHDPDASTATAIGSVLLTALPAGLTYAVYRPLFRRAGTALARSGTPARLEESTV